MADARQHRAEEGAFARPTKGGAVRTRIALTAIVSIAFIIILIQAVTEQPAVAVNRTTTPSKAATPAQMSHSTLAAYRALDAAAPSEAKSLMPFDLNAALLADLAAKSAPTKTTVAAPTAPAPASPTQSTAPVAPTTTTTTAPAPAVPAGPVDTVTPEERAAWEQVAMCEEGGDWSYDGSEFSGGLGISRANWIAYGGQEFAPEGAMATEDEQIMVAERIQSYAPDQDGCSGW
jgi:hypothetical protein